MDVRRRRQKPSQDAVSGTFGGKDLANSTPDAEMARVERRHCRYYLAITLDLHYMADCANGQCLRWADWGTVITSTSFVYRTEPVRNSKKSSASAGVTDRSHIPTILLLSLAINIA